WEDKDLPLRHLLIISAFQNFPVDWSARPTSGFLPDRGFAKTQQTAYLGSFLLYFQRFFRDEVSINRRIHKHLCKPSPNGLYPRNQNNSPSFRRQPLLAMHGETRQ